MGLALDAAREAADTPCASHASDLPAFRRPSHVTRADCLPLSTSDSATQGALTPSHTIEVPVGAVLVGPDGTIVAQAHNAPETLCDPSAHAEMLALRLGAQRLGSYRLGGCVMVVTLEPCLMCVGAMVHARLAGVVYGAADLKTGAVASCLEGFELPLHNHRVWHMGGVRSHEAARLLHDFFHARR